MVWMLTAGIVGDRYKQGAIAVVLFQHHSTTKTNGSTDSNHSFLNLHFLYYLAILLFFFIYNFSLFLQQIFHYLRKPILLTWLWAFRSAFSQWMFLLQYESQRMHQMSALLTSPILTDLPIMKKKNNYVDMYHNKQQTKQMEWLQAKSWRTTGTMLELYMPHSQIT